MKRKLINSFFILSIITTLSKVFSILNRMLLTRLIPPQSMSLYLYIMPSLSLCLTLGQLGIPSALYRLLLHPQSQKYKVVISCFVLSLFSSSIIMISLYFFLPTLSSTLLKNNDTYYPMLTFIIFIPLVSISGILKNILLARNHYYMVAKTQIIEEVIRLLFCWMMLESNYHLSNIYHVFIAYLSMSVGELSSIIYMSIKLLSKYKPPKQYHFEIDIYKDILNISLPLTGSRLIHSLVRFLEPIILVSGLINLHPDTISSSYAIINGYVLTLLNTPMFLNTIIYRIYQPIASHDIYFNLPDTKRHFIYALLSSLLLGLPFTLLFMFFPEFCLSLIYNTTSGARELSYMALPFLLFYLQTPISVILYASNSNKALFYISVSECFIELLTTILLCPYFKVHAILISFYLGLLISLVSSFIIAYRIIKGS